MSRPTKAEVDEVLAEYKGRGCDCNKHLLPRVSAHYLAAEVRALRQEGMRLKEENAKLREELAQHKRWAGDRNYCDSCGKSILNIVTANATLARVEALPAKWRRKEFVNLIDHHAVHECAQELEAELRGAT